MTAREMVDMKLNDSVVLNNNIENRVIRVPGGWIYCVGHGGVFVPLDMEFANKEYLERNPPKEFPA